MIKFLLGIIGWLFLQYIGHRTWHYLITKNSTQYYAIGEKTHHQLWNIFGIIPEEDITEKFISPPWWPPILLGFGFSLWHIEFGLGFIIAFIIDHVSHIIIHHGRLKWLAQFHAIHHINGTCNYGTGLALGLDWLFGTYQGIS